jgi:hypothetical protein
MVGEKHRSLEVFMRIADRVRAKLNEEEVDNLVAEVDKHKQCADANTVAMISQDTFWNTKDGLSIQVVEGSLKWAEQLHLVFGQDHEGGSGDKGSKVFQNVLHAYMQTNMASVPSVLEFLQVHIPGMFEQFSTEAKVYAKDVFSEAQESLSLKDVDRLWAGARDVMQLDAGCEDLEKTVEAGELRIREELKIMIACKVFSEYSVEAVELLSAYAEIRNFDYRKKGEHLQQVAALFRDRLTHTESDLAVALQEMQESKRLVDLATALHEVREHTNAFDTQTWNLLGHLAFASELIAFITEVKDFDAKKLIDGAEEHAYDHFAVNAKTVKDFIALQRFLKPLLREDFDNVEELLKSLVRRFRQHRETNRERYGERDSSVGIDQLFASCAPCAGGLKRMYRSLANRGEATQQIAKTIVQSGQYIITGPQSQVEESHRRGFTQEQLNLELPGSLSERNSKMLAETNARCTSLCDTECANIIVENGDADPIVYDLTRLRDLKSRALLYTNSLQLSRETNSASESTQTVMVKLNSNLEILEDIVTYLIQLCALGHFEFRSYYRKISSSELSIVRTELTKSLVVWKDALLHERSLHRCLQFFRSSQLLTLQDGFCGKLVGAQRRYFDAILQYATPDRTMGICSGPEVSTNGIDEEPEPEIDEPEPESALDLQRTVVQVPINLETTQMTAQAQLSHLGTLLDSKISAPVVRQILHTTSSSEDIYSAQHCVQPGFLYVARCQEQSDTLPALMSLLIQEGTYPSAHQVVFCSRQTVFEELELLVQRSASDTRLHCIVHPERLQGKLQFELVATLRKQCDQNRLALVSCEKTNSHILGEFPESEHRFQLVNVAAFSSQLRHLNAGRGVFAIQSTHAGLGKSDLIRQHAHHSGHLLQSFHISGVVDWHEIVARLAALNLSTSHALHLDIAPVSDPAALNILLFQLLIFRTVTVDISVCHLPDIPIYIEIANTINETLASSVPVATAFSIGRPLEWNLDRFIFSKELESPGQIVCNYLKALQSDDVASNIEHKDLNFGENSGATGDNVLHVKALLDADCCAILRRHFELTEFVNRADCSFTTVHIFLKVLAMQLCRFTHSPFFSTGTISQLNRGNHAMINIRSRTVEALKRVAYSFADRSVQSVKVNQHLNQDSNTTTSVDEILERSQITRRWESGNHVLIIFQRHGKSSISALYRNLHELKEADPDLVSLLQSQRVPLREFTKATHTELLDELNNIARNSKVELASSSNYALTADNMLKMALVVLRLQASVPVIIVGHSGCGKTSLLSFLSQVCDIPSDRFKVLNIHAGTNESSIGKFISELNILASTSEVWGFLDEVNTCECLGLINDLLCHRTHHGRQLHPNIKLMACANPYEKRQGRRYTEGFTEKLAIDDKFSGLTYRVHPLPESMMDFVFDYGALAREDEPAYVRTMLDGVCGSEEKLQTVIDLIVKSQEFIRCRYGADNPDNSAISLRDVKRVRDLIGFFYADDHAFFAKRKLAGGYIRAPQEHYPDEETCAWILSLAHCYYVRLDTTEQRAVYRDLVAGCLSTAAGEFTESDFDKVLYFEQKDILERMNFDVHPNTAHNGALMENVFVAFVCIMMKIPLFVVGKPGNSKSLSMLLLDSSLKGPDDSRDPLLRLLPEVFFVHYQGSEDSTSEGIITVFNKARKYLDEERQSDDAQAMAKSIPVVLLDEVGLAEVSRHNPLKVLHSLLEPAFGTTLDIGVVGISNWALDAAKMNRAIHLSRPEPDVRDLCITGQAVLSTFTVSEKDTEYMKERLEEVASSYYEYYKSQETSDFHGLRDYYALIKSIGAAAPQQKRDFNIALKHSLARNFGGLPNQMKKIEQVFLNAEHQNRTPAKELILQNLADENARHLLVSTSGDSALQIIQAELRDLGKSVTVMHGSEFQLDRSGDYSYRILSQIILCMETGGVLIMQDLDTIYGALYDMLNQNYVVVDGKRHCRVALGADSNPMCGVDISFRCIVLVNKEDLKHKDPPFLNRFEKQALAYEDRLAEEHPFDRTAVASKLRRWVSSVSVVASDNGEFDEKDAFLGYCESTVPSLVLAMSKNALHQETEVFEQCKTKLLATSTEDAIVRLAKVAPEEREWCEGVYYQQRYANFSQYINAHVDDPQVQSLAPSKRFHSKMIVMTFSSVHESPMHQVPAETEIHPVAFVESMEPVAEAPSMGSDEFVDKVGAFQSENEFMQRLDAFWASTDQLYILQANAATDFLHFKLIRSKIDQYQGDREACKHICLIVHVDREPLSDEGQWQCDHLSGWDQTTIDLLGDAHETSMNLHQMRGQSIQNAFQTAFAVRDIIKEELPAVFYGMKYPPGARSLLHIKHMVARSRDDARLLGDLEVRIMGCIETKRSNSDWLEHLAHSRKELFQCSTLAKAAGRHMRRQVYEPLAEILFELEALDTLRTYFFLVDTKQSNLVEFWRKIFRDPKKFNVATASVGHSNDLHAVGYDYDLKLYFPFSRHFMQQAQQLQHVFEHEYQMKRSELADALDEGIELFVEHLKEGRLKARCPQFDTIDFREADNLRMYRRDVVLLLSLGSDLQIDTVLAGVSPMDIDDAVRNRRQEVVEMVMREYCPTLCDSAMDLHICLWRYNVEITAELGIISVIPRILDIHSQHASRTDGTRSLIATACKEMIHQVVASTDGFDLQAWHRSAYRIIQHANVMGCKTVPSLLALATCEEFCRLVILPASPEMLYRFKEFVCLAQRHVMLENELCWELFYQDVCFQSVLQFVSDLPDSNIAPIVSGYNDFLLSYMRMCVEQCQHEDTSMWDILIRSLFKMLPLGDDGVIYDDIDGAANEPCPEVAVFCFNTKYPERDILQLPMPCIADTLIHVFESCLGTCVRRPELIDSIVNADKILVDGPTREILKNLNSCLALSSPSMAEAVLVCDLMQQIYLEPSLDANFEIYIEEQLKDTVLHLQHRAIEAGIIQEPIDDLSDICDEVQMLKLIEMIADAETASPDKRACLIEELLFTLNVEQYTCMAHSADRLTTLLKRSRQVLQNTFGADPICWLCCIACVKTVLSKITSIILNPGGIQILLGVFDHHCDFLVAINEIMCAKDSITRSFQLWFLKKCRLSPDVDIARLKALCANSDCQKTFPWFADIEAEWQQSSTTLSLSINPFLMPNDYSIANQAIGLLYQDDPVGFQEILKLSFQSDSMPMRIAILSALTVRLHLSESEESTSSALMIEVLDSVQPTTIFLQRSPGYLVAAQRLAEGNVPWLQNMETEESDPTNSIWKQTATLVAFIAVASMDVDASILARYSCQPQEVADDYLLAGPPNTEAIAYQAVAAAEGTTYTRFKCACGFTYLIGECGQPMATSTCPTCKRSIGGRSHIPEAGQQQVQGGRVGVGRDPATDELVGFHDAGQRDLGSPVRRLHPPAALLLDLIVHWSMRFGQIFAPRHIQAFHQSRVPNFAEYCIGHIDKCWQKLKDILNISDETLSILIMDIVYGNDKIMSLADFCATKATFCLNVERREEWETAFQSTLIQPRITALAAFVHAFRGEANDSATRAAMQPSLFDMEIEELNRISAPYSAKFYPNLFRKVLPKSKSALQAAVVNDMNVAQSFPFLKSFFECEENIALLRNLFPLIRWTNIIASR